jgi:glycosyltransferase involved in cell wall biosynthesis
LYQQPAKGVDLLLNAWSTVHQKFPNVLLQIVGDGVNNAYREFVNRLGIAGTVDFAGRQHDLTNYYSNADIFVLPSRREGMSNALMEAMLYGLPSVATDISGNRDLLKNRVNGILVPAADIASLAEAIAWMLSHPDERLEYGLKARETILKHYDINNIADQYISLYQNLLNKTHSFLK